MFEFKTILHPTDFSEASRSAFEIAGSLAADYHAHLVIVHVTARSLALPDDVVRRLEEGNSAAEILRIAHLCRADLIVMGSRGRAGPGRWFMGSVAEAVMGNASCPVLTLTAKSTHQSLRSMLSQTAVHP